MVSITIAVQYPAVQNKIISRVTAELEKKLKTKVRISRVNIKFFKSIQLKGIYIEDQRKDTLLYADKLLATISVFELRNRKLTIESVELENARIKVRRFKDEKAMNFDFIIDAFSSNDTTPSAKKPWDFNLQRIKLVENVFSYRDERWSDYTPCIDFEDVHLSHLNVDVDQLKFYDDSTCVRINNISGFEKSGFRVNHFAANSTIASNYMRFNQLKIVTPHSNLKLDYEMQFDSYDDFEDYINKVHMKADVSSSTLSSDDLQYFASELFGLNKTITLSGSAKGTVALLKAKKLDIKYGNVSHFRGNVTMNGLPDFDNTFMDIMIDDLTTSKDDIESVPAFPFNEHQKIVLPANFALLKTCRFKGKFTGFYTDFVAYGNANTGLGFISSDINLKTGGPVEVYSGHLTTKDFNIGLFTNTANLLGNISISASVKGQGFRFDKLVSKVEGKVSNLDFNGYNYKNITVNGEIARKLFKGSLGINENNIKFNFDGSVDFRKAEPVFICTAELDNVHLSNLKLIDRDSSSSLSAFIQMNITGSDFDNFNGTMSASDLYYTENGKSITIDSIYYDSYIENNIKHLKLTSDIIDIDVNGINRLTTLAQSISDIVYAYFPVGEEKTNLKKLTDQGNFSISLHNINPVLEIFYPDLTIGNNSKIEGDINTATNQVNILLQSPDVILYGVEFKELSISGKSEAKQFLAKLKAGEFMLNDSLKVNNFSFNASSTRDSANFQLSTRNADSSKIYVDLGATTYFRNKEIALTLLPQSVLVIDKHQWHFSPSNTIVFGNDIVFRDFKIFKDDSESLEISGKVSNNSTDMLNLNFQNFELQPLNHIFKNYDFELGGVANGTIDFHTENDKPMLKADLAIKNFAYYADTLGDAIIKSDFISSKRQIVVDAQIKGGVARNIDVDGYYQLGKGKAHDELHFDGHFTRTSLSTVEHLFEGLASDMNGLMSGDLSLRGTPDKPELTGEVTLQKAGFTIDYLNTHYTFSDKIKFNEKSIEFRNITLNDPMGNKAMLNGKITHNHFTDFGMQITVKPENCMVLNTNEAQNDLFYGQAFATGLVTLGGTFENVNMDINLTSNKGTIINLPLTTPEEVSENSYIVFVKHDSIADLIPDNKSDLTGINMNIDLSVNTNAEINLIFDSKIGDIINGTGKGDLHMTVAEDGTFELLGNYSIVQGSYYFTMKNLIGKYFEIEKGGTIKWSGDPYEGIVDLRAIYTKNAGLYDLLQDTSAQYKKKVPVEVILSLKGKLFNPDIAFDINVLNVEPSTQSLVNRYLNTEEEKNKQAMSLIVLNSFSPPSATEGNQTVGSSANVQASLSEFVTHQLSNWASQISSNFNVDINYTPGDVITSDQFDVAVSTKILDDRVKLSGMVGYADNSTTNASNVVGDFNVEVDVSKDGRFKVKAFNKSNNNTLLYNSYNAPYTQGIGWFYRQEFDRFGDLFRKKVKTTTPADTLNTSK